MSKTQGFRIQTKTLFFTYKTHIHKSWIDVIQEILDEKWKGRKIKEYILCHEFADKEDAYEHTHIALKLNKQIDISGKNARAFDFVSLELSEKEAKKEKNWIHPNIQSARNWAKSVNYCKKEAKNLGYINYWTNIIPKKEKNMSNIIDDVINSGSCLEALKYNAKSMKDVLSIKTIYELKGITIEESYLKELKEIKLNRWQKDFKKILSSEANNRRAIFWIYDEIGGKGKSMFCDYLQANNPENTYVFTSTGSLKDLGDVLRNWMQMGNKPEHVIIDLPRTCEDKNSIYGFLECLKNGRVTCTKYKGTTLIFKPPTVTVFANWKPKIDKMSIDRWKIYNIHIDKLIEEKSFKKIEIPKKENVITISNYTDDLEIEFSN
jgi:hypothetical protein